MRYILLFVVAIWFCFQPAILRANTTEELFKLKSFERAELITNLSISYKSESENWTLKFDDRLGKIQPADYDKIINSTGIEISYNFGGKTYPSIFIINYPTASSNYSQTRISFFIKDWVYEEYVKLKNDSDFNKILKFFSNRYNIPQEFLFQTFLVENIHYQFNIPSRKGDNAIRFYLNNPTMGQLFKWYLGSKNPSIGPAQVKPSTFRILLEPDSAISIDDALPSDYDFIWHYLTSSLGAIDAMTMYYSFICKKHDLKCNNHMTDINMIKVRLGYSHGDNSEVFYNNSSAVKALLGYGNLNKNYLHTLLITL